MLKAKEMGRVTVEIELANYQDLTLANCGFMKPEQVRRARVNGVVDTGATRLVLPQSAVDQLGLPFVGEMKVRYADNRTASRKLVKDVQLRLLDRESTFNAVVEPDRADALIGAIVMEDLDLVVDCSAQTVRYRDPEGLMSEIEAVE